MFRILLTLFRRRRRRRFSLLSLAATLLVALTVALPSSFAAEGEQSASPAGVVIVDVKHVFENFTELARSKKELQIDVNLAEVDTKIEHARIKALLEDLKGLKAGSDEHLALESRIREASAALQVDVQRHKSEFVRRESEAYWRAYQRVQYVVREVAKQRKAVLVIRHSRETVDQFDPQSVMRGLSNPLVSFERHIDITDEVLSRLNNLHVVMEPIDLR